MSLDRLTARELDCLRGYAEHGSVKSTARVLGIAPGTVEDHLAKARQKLGTRTSLQAAHLVRDQDRALPDNQGGGFPPIGDDLNSPAFLRPVRSEGDGFRDSAADRGGFESGGDRSLRRAIDEVLSGRRPDGLTLFERGALTIAAVMVIGFVYFGLSAVTAAMLGAARIVRASTH